MGDGTHQCCGRSWIDGCACPPEPMTEHPREAGECPLGDAHGTASTFTNADGETCCDFCGHPTAREAGEDGLMERLRELRYRLWPAEKIGGDGPRVRDVQTVDEAADTIASYRAALERAHVIVLEQRCERGTPWDLACVTIAQKVREHTDSALTRRTPK